MCAPQLGRTGSVFPEQYTGQDQYDVDELEDLLETFNESINGVYNKLYAVSDACYRCYCVVCL